MRQHDSNKSASEFTGAIQFNDIVKSAIDENERLEKEIIDMALASGFAPKFTCPRLDILEKLTDILNLYGDTNETAHESTDFVAVFSDLLGSLSFAVANAAIIFEEEYQKGELSDEPFDAHIIQSLTLISKIHALQSEAYKKGLLRYDDFQNKSETSTKRQEAAYVRHAETNKIKADYVQWYFSNKDAKVFHSFNQAADKFHEQLEPEKKKKIQPPALVKHLRESLKQLTNNSPANT